MQIPELCPLPVGLLGSPAGKPGGGGLVLSGRSAPAHTGAGPRRARRRSTDGRGRPWRRCAGWGRTAGVALEGGGGETGPGCARVGEELPPPSRAGPKPPRAAFRPRTAQSHRLPAPEPALDPPGCGGQGSAGPARGAGLCAAVPRPSLCSPDRRRSVHQQVGANPTRWAGTQTLFPARLGAPTAWEQGSQGSVGRAGRQAGRAAGTGLVSTRSGKWDTRPDDGNSPACLRPNTGGRKRCL